MSNYFLVKEEIASRVPDREVGLIAVSKYAPLQAIQDLYAEGCRDFGESRIQEALPKINALPKDIRWHFIGKLQSNKIGKVIEHFSLIHSVDSAELAELINRKSAEIGKVTSILLQVNTSKEATKQGFTPDDCRRIFDQLAKLSSLKIEGLMTMAPLTTNTEVIRASFADLRALKEELNLSHLSMGMSQDYPIAIEEGATLLRIGRKIMNLSQ